MKRALITVIIQYAILPSPFRSAFAESIYEAIAALQPILETPRQLDHAAAGHISTSDVIQVIGLKVQWPVDCVVRHEKAGIRA